MQKELLSLYDRITLQENDEFGSQIGQVNDLLMRVGERFSSMVSHAHVKIENQEERYQKLQQETDEEIKGLKSTVKDLKQQFKEKEEENKELADKEMTARMDKYRLEDQLERQHQESEERIAELKDAIIAKNEKIADKNEKIDGLEVQLQSMQDDLSKVDEMKAQHRKETERLNSVADESKVYADQLEGRIQGLNQEVESLKDKHHAELERVSERLSYEKDVVLLEADREHQQKLAKVYEEHNRRIADLYERLQLAEPKEQGQENALEGQMKIEDIE